MIALAYRSCGVEALFLGGLGLASWLGSTRFLPRRFASYSALSTKLIALSREIAMLDPAIGKYA